MIRLIHLYLRGLNTRKPSLGNIKRVSFRQIVCHHQTSKIYVFIKSNITNNTNQNIDKPNRSGNKTGFKLMIKLNRHILVISYKYNFKMHHCTKKI